MAGAITDTGFDIQKAYLRRLPAAVQYWTREVESRFGLCNENTAGRR
jgi:hypothetical protein